MMAAPQQPDPRIYVLTIVAQVGRVQFRQEVPSYTAGYSHTWSIFKIKHLSRSAVCKLFMKCGKLGKLREEAQTDPTCLLLLSTTTGKPG